MLPEAKVSPDQVNRLEETLDSLKQTIDALCDLLPSDAYPDLVRQPVRDYNRAKETIRAINSQF